MMQEVQQRAEVKQWQHNIVVYPFYNNFKRDSVCDVVTKHLIRRAPLFLLSLIFISRFRVALKLQHHEPSYRGAPAQEEDISHTY